SPARCVFESPLVTCFRLRAYGNRRVLCGAIRRSADSAARSRGCGAVVVESRGQDRPELFGCRGALFGALEALPATSLRSSRSCEQQQGSLVGDQVPDRQG